MNVNISINKMLSTVSTCVEWEPRTLIGGYTWFDLSEYYEYPDMLSEWVAVTKLSVCMTLEIKILRDEDGDWGGGD